MSEQPKTPPPTAKLVGDGEDILMTGFYRMDLQALCLLGADENRTYVQFELRNPIISLPAKFASIDEARNARNVLVWNGYRRFYQTDFYQLGPKEAIPPSAMEVRDYLVRQLYTLHEQIDLLLLDSKPDLHLHPLARPDAMKVYSTTLLIRLAMSLQAQQTTSDALLREFEYLLSMARRALEFEADGCPMIQSTSLLTAASAVASLIQWHLQVLEFDTEPNEHHRRRSILRRSPNTQHTTPHRH